MTFSPRIVYGDTDLAADPFAVEFGFNLGNGVTLYDVAASLLVDGSIMSSPGAGNREGLVIPVIVEAPDAFVAAEYGAALDAEADKPFNTLTFYPGDGYGPATVLETFPAQRTHDWDQDLEQEGLRRFLLEIPALPFGRSVDPESFTYTGPGAELDPLTSVAGWTTVSGTTPTVVADTDEGNNSVFRFSDVAVIEKTLGPLQEYLWVKTGGSGQITAVTVGGVAASIPATGVALYNAGGRYFQAIPVPEEMVGTSAAVRLTSGGAGSDLYELWTVGYPSKVAAASLTHPRGIGLVDVVGSARTRCTIQFTAPAGGAFVYTAPDPNVAVRERGVGEVLFANFTVASADGAEVSVGSQLMWFPQGTHSANIGVTAPQPLLLDVDPTAVAWPQQMSGVSSAVTGSQWAYPADAKAATTFYDTSGAKTLVSPSPSLPEGYHGGAVHHEVHSLHPGRCGFAVLDINGDPVTTTVTYYPRWWSHAAQ